MLLSNLLRLRADILVSLRMRSSCRSSASSHSLATIEEEDSGAVSENSRGRAELLLLLNRAEAGGSRCGW